MSPAAERLTIADSVFRQDMARANPDRQKEMAKKLEEGKLSIRDWREQIQNVMNMYVYLEIVHSHGRRHLLPGALFRR